MAANLKVVNFRGKSGKKTKNDLSSLQEKVLFIENA
jgi:hypothetical protein